MQSLRVVCTSLAVLVRWVLMILVLINSQIFSKWNSVLLLLLLLLLMINEKC